MLINDICWVDYFGHALIARLKEIDIEEKWRDGKHKVALVCPPPEDDVEIADFYTDKIYKSQEEAIIAIVRSKNIKDILE